MPKLARFSTPAREADRHAGAWSAAVSRIFEPHADGHLPQFYDPTQRNTPPRTPEPMLLWAAFPARLRATIPSQEERWRVADGDRNEQDEYCEWSVVRNPARKITRITFTSEVPEYWEHLFATDEQRVVDLYQELVDPRVRLAHLRGPDGGYDPRNRWNSNRPGRLAHMIQGSNNLGAAVDLVANATVPRARNGRPVTNQQELVRCARLGEPLRNSDPQIASAVNAAAREGNEITLADPLGLYLGPPLTAGMATPDGADAAEFWTIERGDREHTVRARFEVPAGHGYVVGDITTGGRPIRFGGQVAERVQVWIKALIRDADHAPRARPCV
jgi:hypothetical protein